MRMLVAAAVLGMLSGAAPEALSQEPDGGTNGSRLGTVERRVDEAEDVIVEQVLADEFYDFRDNPRARVLVVATLDERTYDGGGMGGDHPIAWCQTFADGRSWYTGLGHRLELYTDPFYLEHLERGLLFAAGLSDGC
jgi:type 1 glutamine amidotransferase